MKSSNFMEMKKKVGELLMQQAVQLEKRILTGKKHHGHELIIECEKLMHLLIRLKGSVFGDQKQYYIRVCSGMIVLFHKAQHFA